MPTLKMSRQQAARLLAARVESGKRLATQAELAEQSGAFRDWLCLVATWSEETIAELEAVYAEREIGQQFRLTAETSERSRRRTPSPTRGRRSIAASTS